MLEIISREHRSQRDAYYERRSTKKAIYINQWLYVKDKAVREDAAALHPV